MKEKNTTEPDCQSQMSFPQLVQSVQELDVVLNQPEIEALLTKVVCRPDDYQPYLSDAEPYGRVSVVKSDFGTAEMLVITWQTNQQSPIHDHYESSCGIRVLQGKMTETLYQLVEGHKVLPKTSREWLQGEITSAEASFDIHKISNTNEALLVTLHIYSVPLDPTKMRRFVGIE